MLIDVYNNIKYLKLTNTNTIIIVSSTDTWSKNMCHYHYFQNKKNNNNAIVNIVYKKILDIGT